MVVVISGSPSELTIEHVEYELHKANSKAPLELLHNMRHGVPVFTHGSLTKSTSASILCQYKIRNAEDEAYCTPDFIVSLPQTQKAPTAQFSLSKPSAPVSGTPHLLAADSNDIPSHALLTRRIRSSVNNHE